MGKQIYFTDEEIKELKWVIPMFKSLHEDSWTNTEEKIINNIINKIDKSSL